MEKQVVIILLCIFAILSCNDTSNSKTNAISKDNSKQINSKTQQTNSKTQKNNSKISGKNSQKKVTLTNRTLVEEEVNGKRRFITYCSNCHGQDGKLALAGATDLTKSTLNLDQTISVIKNGKGNMMAYQGVINKAKIEASAKFVMRLKLN